MYFTTRTSRGKQILQLLESYRNADGKPRNRVVLSLGMRELERERGQMIAQVVEDELYQRPTLAIMDDDVIEEANEIVQAVRKKGTWQPLGGTPAPDNEVAQEQQSRFDGVLVDRVCTHTTTSLGPELVAMHAWEELQLDSLLQRLDFNPAQRQAACVQIIARMVAPGSELALTERFLSGSSLPELLGLKHDTKINKDRYYRVSDRLIDNRDAIESYLQQTIANKLCLQRTYYLYDLTNTHFEGLGSATPKAKRGKSKQKRNDCPLVAAGVCFDEHGFMLFHRTFDGNTGDAKTLPEMIKILQDTLNEQQLLLPPVIVLDGGLASKDNLKTLREAGLNFLVNRTRNYRNHFAEQFEQAGFQTVPDRQVQVSKLSGDQLPKIKAIGDDEQQDQFVLCRSVQRGQKESAIRSKADIRMLDDLEKLATRISQGKLKDPEKIEQAIGRLRERHSRVARYYSIEHCDGQLLWEQLDHDLSAAANLDGCYVLQAHGPQMSAIQTWKSYMVLTKAEDGFRCLKSHLGLRPIHHRLEHRVDGHIFISLLAYQLMRYVCYKLEAQGDRRNWATLRSILRSHCYATTELPTTGGAVHVLRKPCRPEVIHQQIYTRLGIDLAGLPSHRSCHKSS